MNYLIERLEFPSLDAERKEAYSLFTEPHMRHYIHETEEEGPRVIAVGASQQEIPIGLGLAILYPNLGHVEILSLYVVREHRKKGLGSQIFAELEKNCVKEGGKVFTFNYRKEPYYGLVYESIFFKQGWNEPKPYMEQYLFYVPLFNPRWIKYQPKIPRKFTVFSWKYLKKKEREQIEKDYMQGIFNSIVYPFFEENRIELLNSLGLRHKGKVEGWIITHRVSLDVIRYTALYVLADLQFTGFSMRLLIDSINLNKRKESFIRWAIVPINLQDIDRTWYHFIKRRLAPISQGVIHIYQTWKAV